MRGNGGRLEGGYGRRDMPPLFGGTWPVVATLSVTMVAVVAAVTTAANSWRVWALRNSVSFLFPAGTRR